MAEQCAANSDFKGYLNWLPKKSETLPHYWGKRNESALDLLGLKEQIDDDNERLENDWLLAKKVVEKLPERFGNKSIDVLKEEFKQYSLVVMSYSFEETKEQEEDLFCETEETEEQKFRMMMPVGDLLNHTADNNARIEIDDDTGDHTINATKKIKAGDEIFNTFGNMSNSRLLHMYGFAEEANDADDVYLSAESIESGIYEYESKIPAIKAKIKLLQNHGFMDEVRVSKDEELVESFRVLLAIIVMEKPAFNKMVKESKKKAVNGEVTELEIELGSNKLEDLDDFEKQIFKTINQHQRAKLQNSELMKRDSNSLSDLETFIKIALKSSISVLDHLDKIIES